jgi:hypothetical protein
MVCSTYIREPICENEVVQVQAQILNQTNGYVNELSATEFLLLHRIEYVLGIRDAYSMKTTMGFNIVVGRYFYKRV